MQRAHESTARWKLIAAREAKGWTQQQLADKLEVNRITIVRWEEGSHAPQPYYLNNLCHILDRTLLELGLIDEHLAVSQALVDEPEDDQQDSYTHFLASNLTLRLWHIVCHWTSYARYQELQMIIIAELEDNTTMNPDDTLSRRDALRLLASLPIETCGLTVLQPVFRRSKEEILTHCAAGVTACWYLRKGKDLAFASDTVSKYLPTLKAITIQGTTPQRKAAADLMAQGLLLKAHLAKHLTNTTDAIRYAQQAEQYSEQAENPLLQIAVFRMLDSEYSYANYWGQALQSARKAEKILKAAKSDQMQPIVFSWVYSSLASDEAYHGHKDEALRLLQKAQTMFFAQPPNEHMPVWVRHNIGCLLLNDGLARQYLGMSEDAFNSFEQIVDLHTNSEVVRVEATINQAMTEASRDDKPRDMKKCTLLWKDGITGAKNLNSREWFNTSVNTYKVMQAAWPHEKEIKDLREYLIR